MSEITLRDYLAAHALSGLTTIYEIRKSHSEIAREAYSMLKESDNERRKRKTWDTY